MKLAPIKLGDHGQCEAVDIVPTEDDGVAVRCHRAGRRIQERSINRDFVRWRIVCPLHGLTSALEIN